MFSTDANTQWIDGCIAELKGHFRQKTCKHPCFQGYLNQERYVKSQMLNMKRQSWKKTAQSRNL